MVCLSLSFQFHIFFFHCSTTNSINPRIWLPFILFSWSVLRYSTDITFRQPRGSSPVITTHLIDSFSKPGITNSTPASLSFLHDICAVNLFLVCSLFSTLSFLHDFCAVNLFLLCSLFSTLSFLHDFYVVNTFLLCSLFSILSCLHDFRKVNRSLPPCESRLRNAHSHSSSNYSLLYSFPTRLHSSPSTLRVFLAQKTDMK